MKFTLQAVTFIISLGLMHAAHAQPVLFYANLTVNNVVDPHVSVGRHKNPARSIDSNTFAIKGRQSDYFFTVKYQHNGASKEAICEISGAPQHIVATINPAKEGREACKTQESRRS